MGFFEDLISGLYGNPVWYLSITFAFSALVAVILPLPIELVLLAPILDQRWGYLLAVILAMSGGKTVGAWAIFYFGLHVEGRIRRWADRYKWIDRFVRWAERFVRKTNYLGLYLLLSIPLMTDTVPLYVYSLFNKEGRAVDQRGYLVANFLGAWTRALFLVLIYLSFEVFLIR